jgi:hypothetical protein
MFSIFRKLDALLQADHTREAKIEQALRARERLSNQKEQTSKFEKIVLLQPKICLPPPRAPFLQEKHAAE